MPSHGKVIEVTERSTEPVSDTLRISDMLVPRKIPPKAGWRKALHAASFAMVNPGESPIERHCRELRGRISRHVRRQYVIAFVSGKGGVGTTTMTACVGGVFAECRTENVAAIDAAPGFGTLAGRIDETPPGDYSGLLADPDLQGYADIREHLGRNDIGLEVLAGDRNSDRSRPLGPEMFDGALGRLRRTHTIVLVDTSGDLEHPVISAVLDACDTLVFVSGLTPDTSLPVTRVIDLLRSMGRHELVARSVVILNDARGSHDGNARAYLTERFSQCGPAVEFMPYDPHLAEGGIIDTRNGLRKSSRLRLAEITAAIADKYVPDTDKARR